MTRGCVCGHDDYRHGDRDELGPCRDCQCAKYVRFVMTAKMLIAELLKMPPDAPVAFMGTSVPIEPKRVALLATLRSENPPELDLYQFDYYEDDTVAVVTD